MSAINEIMHALSSVNNIINSDLLMSSKETKNTEIYSSKKITVKNISDQEIKVFPILSALSVYGKWTYDHDVLINTKNILSNESIINVEYLSTKFYPLLEKLENELYKEEHVPSYVGEIIYSTTLKTEEKVKKVYGNYTCWEQIKGRFIFAANNNDLFAKDLGGQYTTEFNITHIPGHNHGFIPDDTEKTFRYSYTWNPVLDEKPYIGVIGQNDKTVASCSYWSEWKEQSHSAGDVYTVENKAIEHLHHAPVDRESPRGGKIGYADLYGIDGPDVRIRPNNGKSINYKVLPPFVTVYIWKRVS